MTNVITINFAMINIVAEKHSGKGPSVEPNVKFDNILKLSLKSRRRNDELDGATQITGECQETLWILYYIKSCGSPGPLREME